MASVPRVGGLRRAVGAPLAGDGAPRACVLPGAAECTAFPGAGSVAAGVGPGTAAPPAEALPRLGLGV